MNHFYSFIHLWWKYRFKLVRSNEDGAELFSIIVHVVVIVLRPLNKLDLVNLILEWNVLNKENELEIFRGKFYWKFSKHFYMEPLKRIQTPFLRLVGILITHYSTEYLDKDNCNPFQLSAKCYINSTHEC